MSPYRSYSDLCKMNGGSQSNLNDVVRQACLGGKQAILKIHSNLGHVPPLLVPSPSRFTSRDLGELKGSALCARCMIRHNTHSICF
jgi:hypothetical protein